MATGLNVPLEDARIGDATAGVPSGASEGTPQAREIAFLLRRLSRAVQRATIYPKEHPSVQEAVEALHDGAAPMLSSASVSIVVSRERLLAAHGSAAPSAHTVPWLSARLHDRGIASLSLDAAFERSSALRLAEFLAAPGEVTEADTTTSIPGVRVTRFDCSRARFRDAPNRSAAAQAEAELVWGAIANGLAADWCVSRPGDTAVPDPAELADQMRAIIAEREGTGVSELSARVIAQGGQLAQLPEAVRNIVRQKLAAFVSRLAPELRGQLLRVVPTDSPEKLNLLVELVDALPSHDMLEVMQNVDLTPGGAPRQFLTLLRKFATLGVLDPANAPSAEALLGRSALSPALLRSSEPEIREVLEQLFSPPADQTNWLPGPYQARIEELANRLEAGREYALHELADPCSNDAVAAQVNAITLQMLRAEPAAPASAVLLRRLRDQAVREIETGRLASVGEVVAIIERTTRHAGELPAPLAKVAEEYLAVCRQRHTIDAVVAAIENTDVAASEPLVRLLRVGDHPAALAAVARLVAARDDVVRDRLALALARVPAEIFRATVLPLLPGNATLARTVLGAFARVDRDRAVSLAQTQASHASADVRLRALELLFREPLTTPRFDRLLRQALDDPDTRIVALGIEQAYGRTPLAGFPAMTAFLAALRGATVAPFQHQLVQLLCAHPTLEARDVLADALAARTRAFDLPSRSVSRAMADALDAFADDEARRAASRWRRSLAGLWSTLLRDIPEAA